MKKVYLKSLMLMLVMMCMSITASAYDFVVDGIYYTKSGTDVYVAPLYSKSTSNVSAYTGDVVIPESVTYDDVTYPVIGIYDYAFDYCSGVTSVTLPESITSIGRFAFNGCTGLTSLTIPNSVTSIGIVSFGGCTGLTSVTIPNSVTSIAGNAFSECTGLTSISVDADNPNYCSEDNIIYTKDKSTLVYCMASKGEVTIPTSVICIGDRAFYKSSVLTSVTIPNSVTSIETYAFFQCSSLTSLTIGNSVTSIGDRAFSGCTGLTSVLIGNSVTSIGESAFWGCSGLTSVTIPNCVTSIGDCAFCDCSGLQKIFCLGETPATLGGSSAIPQGTIYVPAGAKSAYSSASYWSDTTIYEGYITNDFFLQLVDDSYLMVLRYVGNVGDSDTQTIPSSAVCGDNTYNVTKIDDSAFTGNLALTNVVMPSSIETIGTYAFQGCSNLKSVTLSKNITTLSDYAFQNCTSLESIAILAGTITVGNYVFDGCTSLATVTMKDYVTSIGSYCFRGCENLTSITMSKNITNISSYAFQNCKSLPSVSLTGVVSISSYAYDGCTSISEVSIPANCTSIATTAFNGCTALKAFTVDASNTSYNTIDGVLTNYGKTQIVAYPSAKGSTYEIPSTIKYIGEYSFRGSELTSISIPSTVTYIYNYAFADCKKLTKAIFENSTSSITVRNYIFQNDSLESVEIYRNISPYNSGSYTPFYNMTSLKTAVLGSGITSIYSSMFYGCTSLNSVTLNDAITTIGSSAFYNCSSLASIKIPATVTSIGDAFLSGCSALKEINAKMQTPPVLQSTAFTSVDKDACKLIVPAEYVETYGETPGWMAFNNIVAEDDASLRKMTVSLTDGGTVTIDSRTYNCEGSHSFYTSATEDVKVVITPNAGYYLKSVKQNGTNVAGQMTADTLLLAKAQTETTLDVTFAPSTETTDISTLDYAIYATEVTGVAGKQVTIPVNMKNVNAIAAWQADLVLPEGFSIATDSYGDAMVSIAGDRTTTARHSIATSTVNGVTHILCSSTSNKTFSDTDGEVATITLNVADTVESADYPIILKNQVIVEADETGHDVDVVVSKITIQSYTPGDVNNDGKINAQDLVAIVNYILENPTSGNIREAADLNGDDKIDARDYVAEVNLILSQGSSSAKAKNMQEAECTGDFNIDSFTIAAGEEKTVNIMLDNANTDYSCAQLDIQLPEGLSLVDAESLSRYHSLAYRELEDGNIRILLSSAANKTIISENGIISLTVKADSNMANGLYGINSDNGLLVTSNGSYVATSAKTFNFSVDSATGINNVDANVDVDDAARYNLSGQRVKASAKGIVIVNGKKTLVK